MEQYFWSLEFFQKVKIIMNDHHIVIYESICLVQMRIDLPR